MNKQSQAEFRWDVYRVKKQFDLSGVLYPVGAVRFWTLFEAEEFKTHAGNCLGMKPPPLDAWFEDHLEIVYWHSDAAQL